MADYAPPDYDPYGQRPNIQPLPFMSLPSIAPQGGNAFTQGVSSGISGTESATGRFLQGIGNLTGLQGLEAYGKDVGDRNGAAATAAGRPELEGNPFAEGGVGLAGLPKFLAYQGGKLVAPIGTLIGGSLAAGAAAAAAPELAAGVGLARLGMMLPEMLGGATAAEGAIGAGARFAGGALASYPTTAGGMYQSAIDRGEAGGGAPTKGDAALALGLGLPAAALNMAEVGGASQYLAKGESGNVFQRFASGAAKGALTNLSVGATQSALDQSFRPDLSLQDRAANVVNAAVSGAIVGGAVGGGIGMLRRVKTAAPGDIPNEAIENIVDQTIQPPQVGGLPALQGGRDVAARSTPPAPGSNQIEGPGVAGLLTHQPIITDFTGTADGRVSDNPANLTPPAPTGMQGVEPQVPRAPGADFVAGGDGSINAAQNLSPLVPAGERRTVFDAPNIDPALTTENRPALEAPPAAPKAVSDLFAQYSDSEISSQRAQLEADIAKRNGRSTQDQMQALRLLRAEEARRASGAEAQQPSQGGLFSEHDFDQRLPRTDQQPAAKPAPEPVEAKPDAKPMQDLARQIVGRKVQWMSKIEATDEVGLAAHVQDRLEAGASDDATFKLAEKFGLVDNKNQPLDIDAAIEKAKQTVDRARAATITDPTATDRVDMAQSKLSDLQQKAKILQDVQQRRAGGEVEQQPQSDKSSAGAAPDQSALQMPFAPQKVVGDTQGNLRVEPTKASDPQTAPQTREALKPVVGKMTEDLRNIDARNLPEAVNAVEDHLAENPKPKQTFMKLAQHFGLWEDGKPVSVADAIDKLQTQLAATQEKIDALTPQQAPRSRALAVEAGAIQEKLDVLTKSRDSRADVEQRNKSKPISAQSQTTLTDEAKGLLPHRRQQLLSIVRDQSLPAALKREAQIGLSKIQNQTNDALDHADNVVAKYAAHTGDLTASRTGRTDYAQEHAAAVNGEVVHQNADAALIRTMTPNGKVEYRAAPAPNGIRSEMTKVDVDNYTGGMFPSRVLDNLRAEKAKIEAQERDRTKANPDGPFKDATSNVVASPSVDPRMKGLLTDWMQHLGLGNVRVFLNVPGDITEANRAEQGIHGPFRKAMAITPGDDGQAGNFGPTGKDFYISLHPTGNERIDIDNLGHELGHIIKWTSEATADPATKAAIEKDYQAWLVKTKGMSLADVTRAARGSTTGEAYARRIDPNLDEASPAAQAHRAYITSRDEFFADNVAKHLTSDGKAVGIVAQFFQRVGRLISNLMDLVKSGFIDQNPHNHPVESIKAFLEGMAGKGAPDTTAEMMKPGDYSAFRTQRGLDPKTVNENAGLLSKFADTMRAAADKASSLSPKMKKVALGWSTIEHMTEFYKKEMPELKGYTDGRNFSNSMRARLSGLFVNMYERQQSLPAAAQERIQQLMRASADGIDGRKLWNGLNGNDHEHLHNEPNAKELEKEVTAANKAWTELGKTPGAQDIYRDMIAHHELMQSAHHAQNILDEIHGSEALKSALPMVDPSDEYLSNSVLHETPQAGAKYWKDVLDKQIGQITDYIKQQKGERALLDKKDAKGRAAYDTRISPLERTLLEIKRDQAKTAQAPYFHTGRTGDFFVAFDIKRDAANPKVVDKASLDAVANYIAERGYDNTVLSSLSDKPGVFIRLENEGAGDGLVKLAKELQQQGHVGESIVKGKKSDPRLQTYMQSSQIQSYINNLRAHFDTMKGDDDTVNASIEQMKLQAIAVAREKWLDSLSDRSSAKVAQQRSRVQGYNKDMMQNYAKRSEIAANSIASRSAAPRINDALSKMAANVLEAQRNNDMSLKDVSLRKDILDEITLREQQRGINNSNSYFDIARALNHSFFLGFSPAYVAIQLSQPWTMTLPELGKKHGFMQSAAAMMRVTPMAMRIIKAQMAVGLERGVSHIGEGTITQRVLEKAGVKGKDAEFLTDLINRGIIDMGSQMRELGQVASGAQDTRLAAYLRMSSAFGLHSETLSRLVAGLAARDLHGDKPGAVDYAHHVVNQSLFNYATWNTSRQLGKNGFAGQYTPLSASFTSYQAQLIEKLTREFHTVLTKDATHDEKVEAARFIGGHMAAMTVFAGTLGLPLVSVIARGAELASDLFKDEKDEPWDAKASYRHYVSQMFGNNIGEIIAHGAPRALGIDVAERAGEANILPFSKFLTDKRKWDDRVKDLAVNSMGSPFSMAFNVLAGAGDIAQGNIVEGLKKGAPLAMHNAALAYDMNQNGYTDNSKNQLPITPGTGDIISQLLGFRPAQKAEYQEGRQIQEDRKGILQRRSAEIRKDLAVAMENGDVGERDKLLTRARDFDRANPGFQVLPRMQATMQLRAKARAVADVTGEPLGVRPKDRAGIGLTDFTNY